MTLEPHADVQHRVLATLAGRRMPALAIVIGAGDGTVIDVVTALRADVRCLVLEPDPGTAAALRASAAWSRWASERVRLLAAPDWQGADEAWRICGDDPDDHAVFVAPATAAAKAAALEAARLVGRILFGARANRDARRQFAPRYLANVLANLGAIAHGGRADACHGWWSRGPAVVVGAGPSLDVVLPELVALAPRATIITTDTALRPLVHGGVTPQVVVGADPSEKNARHFLDLPPCDDTWLVAESALDPRAAAAFAGRTAWFRVGSHDPWPWAAAAGLDVPVVEMWGSVLTAAWQLAVVGGCDPIVFVGADLAYTDGRPYARGTTYEYDWAYTATLGAPLDEAWRQQIAMMATLEAPDVHGASVLTSPPLQAFRDWLLTQAARSGRRVVNATGGGILHGPGVVQATLREALGDRPVVARRAMPFRPTRSGGDRRLGDAITAVRTRIARDDRTASPLPAWAAFTGAPLDLETIDGALAAAGEILTAGAAAQASTLVPWPALVASGFRLDRLSHLPEDVRTPRDGAPPPDVVAQAALLVGVAGAALAEAVADPSSSLPAVADPRCLVWPPAVAWPLRLVEALLPPEGGEGARYVDRAVHVPADGAGPRAAGARLTEALVARLASAVAPQADIAAAPRWRAIAALARRGASSTAEAAEAPAVTLAVHAAGATRRVICRTPRYASGRALTGLLLDTAACTPTTLAHWQHGDLALDVTVAGAVALVAPDVLTDDRRVPPSGAVYAVDGGVVLAPLHATTSLRLGDDGLLSPHHEWPASIVGELPMGEGAVAWSNGTSSWPDPADGYVMVRRTPGGPVEREPLPFRPTSGVWAGSHVYWTVFRMGVGRWAPGHTAALFHDDESFCGVVAHGDGVTLAPIARGPSGEARRHLHERSWRLDGTGVSTPIALSDAGGCAGVAQGPGWTASLHPDTDRIRLTRAARQLDLVCHFPVSAAWLGTTLVVCTAGGDVLRFVALAETLDALA